MKSWFRWSLISRLFTLNSKQSRGVCIFINCFLAVWQIYRTVQLKQYNYQVKRLLEQVIKQYRTREVPRALVFLFLRYATAAVVLQDRESSPVFLTLEYSPVFGSFSYRLYFVGVSRGYTNHYQGRGQAIRPTAALINIHDPLI